MLGYDTAYAHVARRHPAARTELLHSSCSSRDRDYGSAELQDWKSSGAEKLHELEDDHREWPLSQSSEEL